MKKRLLALMSIILCSSTPHNASIYPAAANQPKPDKEMHAVVTAAPDIIDLSYADPKTWHSLPQAAQAHDRVLAPEIQFTTRVSGRTRPF
jgi:hypothetical protein